MAVDVGRPASVIDAIVAIDAMAAVAAVAAAAVDQAAVGAAQALFSPRTAALRTTEKNRRLIAKEQFSAMDDGDDEKTDPNVLPNASVDTDDDDTDTDDDDDIPLNELFDGMYTPRKLAIYLSMGGFR